MHKLTLIFILLFISNNPNAQNWTLDIIGQLPEAVTNNAVCSANVNDTTYVFSFCGLDSTKKYSGIHLRSYRFNTISGQVKTLPMIPDMMGKIAAGASVIGNFIYIIGGYHVFKNGNEVSSNKLHIYDIINNKYLPDGPAIPTPIDDHVQMVWRDSLIYVVTGWSNSSNVSLVQIYKPKTNEWIKGDNVPNKQIYKSFGASGFIFNDTIYYYGGAQIGRDFPIQNQLRKGIIDPNEPTKISWSISVPNNDYNGYRMASIPTDHGGHWIGGSNLTYNYDGKAYSNNQGVDPSNTIYSLNPQYLQLEPEMVNGLPMDLRGIGRSNDSTYFILGGMLKNQQVTNKILQLKRRKYILSSSQNPFLSNQSFLIYPNPTRDYIELNMLNYEEINSFDIKIYDINGQLISFIEDLNKQKRIDVSFLNQGMYKIVLSNSKKVYSSLFVIQH